jgi:hypothetical protein
MRPPPEYGYPPESYAAPRPSNTDNVLAGLAHLSVFFAPVIFPLIIWIATRKSSPYTSYQGKQAFVFHLFFWALSVATVVVFIFYGGFFGPNSPFFLRSVLRSRRLHAFFVILGLTRCLAFKPRADHLQHHRRGADVPGKPFHYPLLGWL